MPPPLKIKCRRCGQAFRVTPRATIRAHECPHGLQCLPAKKTRARPEPCMLCFQERQGVLFERPGQQPLFDDE